MSYLNELMQSIIPDPEVHPEKLGATFERIQEVVSIVLGNRAPDLYEILSEAGQPVIQVRESLSLRQAEIISKKLIASTNASNCEKISKAIIPGYDGSTFGGNPMAMAAAMVATKQMKKLNLTTNVVQRSQQIQEGLFALKSTYSFIGDIRIKGFFIGFDLPSKEYVREFQELLKQQKMKTSLSTGKTVRFLPPLIITESKVQMLLTAMGNALKQLQESFLYAA